MRPVTRRLVLALLVLVGLLLLLGALPQYLKAGDPYYLQAEPVDDAAGGANATDGGNETGDANATGDAVPAANLSERAHPYTFEALRDADGDATGRSSPYWRGPFGLKEAFTHSPFDEVDAYRQQYPEATAGDAVRIRYENRTYRLTVIQP